MRILLALILAAPTWAALSSTVVAEVRTAGANTNGGSFKSDASGTDMSQYDNKNAASCTSCQSATINISTTDAVTNNTTTVTSATANFSSAIVGNVIYLSGTGTTTGWYEVTGLTNSTTITVDRATGSTGGTGVTMNIGGAFKIGGSNDDLFFETFEAGNTIYIKSGTYTISGTISIAKAGGASSPIKIIGYTSTRGDNPKAYASQPLVDAGANSWTLGSNWRMSYVAFTGSANGTLIAGTGNQLWYVTGFNTSTSADRPVVTATNANILVFASQLVSYLGRGITMSGTGGYIVGCYIHDSNQGVYVNTNAAITIVDNIIAGNSTAAIVLAGSNTSGLLIKNNTLYGAENKLGIGVSIATGSTSIRLISNIIAGFATGVSHADTTQTIGFDAFNAYYNNTADTSGWTLGVGSVTGTNPTFTDVTQQTGTSATSSTNVLTAASGTPFSNVVDNQDCVTISAGSGTGFITTTPPAKLLIIAHTSNTITLSSGAAARNLTSSGSGSGITWEVTLGHNFAIGTPLKALGFPSGTFPGALTTGYMDPGAAQRQESGSGGTRIF